MGAEALEEQRSDSEHLRLDIEESETRLFTGRKGASTPVPPLARPAPPHVRHDTLRCMEGTLRPPRQICWSGGWLGGGTNLLPHPALPRPERDEPARPPSPDVLRVSAMAIDEGANAVVGAEGGS